MINITLIILCSIIIGLIINLFFNNIYRLKRQDLIVIFITSIFALSIILIISSSKNLLNTNKDNISYNKNYTAIDKTKILIAAIAEYESNNDSTAKNKNSTASGHLQILKGTVDDINKISNKNYSYEDSFNPEKAEEMFHIYQKKYNPKGDIEKAIRVWNGGPNYTVKATQGYYQAVMKIYNRKTDEELDKVIKHIKSLNL